MGKYKIIAFAGRARSGKSELSQALKEKYNAKVISIANYLKFLCCDILQITHDNLNKLKNNKTPLDLMPNERWIEIISKQTGIDKKLISDDLDNIVIKDVRHMLQFIGTDIIRRYKPSWHIEQMKSDIESLSNSYSLFTIDDVRFPNEKKAIEELGGMCFFIVRPSTIKESTNHVSEISLSWQDFKYENIIINDECANYLKKWFLKAYKDGFQKLNWLFLSENTTYTNMNMKYGLEYKNEELFQLVKCQIINKPIKGYFEFNNEKLMKAYEDEILGDAYYFKKQFDDKLKYTLYNPIIIENFKRFV